MSLYEENLSLYAKKIIQPFAESNSLRLTNSEIHQSGIKTMHPYLKQLVAAGLLKEHRIQGKTMHQTYNYTVYEVTPKLADITGIDITQLTQRDDILPENVFKNIRKYTTESKRVSTAEIQDKFNLTLPQALTFLSNLEKDGTIKRETSSGRERRVALDYVTRLTVVPNNVADLCENYLLNRITLTKLYNETKKRRLSVDDVKLITGLSTDVSILKYLGAIYLLESEKS